MMSPSLDPVSEFWSRPVADVVAALQTRAEGLSSAEARTRLAESGPNSLQVHRRSAAWRLFLLQFKSPLVLILLFAASVSAFVQEWTDAAVILFIVVGSALITFLQEYSASSAVESLRDRLKHMVTVLRDGRSVPVPSEEIVAGDVVLLSAGGLIPGDGPLLEAKDLFVDQSVLTGEAFPAEKTAGVVPATAELAERANCVFMGTTVRSGTARMLVVRTAGTSEFGQIAGQLNLHPPETEFERGIRQFGLMLTEIMVALVLIVFALNIISAKPPIDSLLFAIALAVGISPELLPAIITINLSKGAREMAKRGVIVRKLNAIENFGSMDVLCTDKTGTLTEGSIALESALDVDGTSSDTILRLAYLNAHLQTGLANALDDAIVAAHPSEVAGAVKLDEIPYDFMRKRLSIVVRDGDQPPILITKGAVDTVLAACTRVEQGGAAVALDESTSARIRDRFAGWSEQGLRVLGLATRVVPPLPAYTRDDERDLTFGGFLLFRDPPKPDAAEAIDALERLGVKLKIITGDNVRVAAHVAQAVGMPVEGIKTGADLNTLRDEALWHVVEHTDVFAEVDPTQKGRIIRSLQKAGHVVGYMGDGINDAPALHDADVGISVDGAVDVAREAADFVLLQRGLDVLWRGIEEGRVTFANSLKYVFMTTSANFGNMFSMAGASLLLPFLPLLAKQILLNNFLSDFPAIAIAGDTVDREWVERPHRWNVKFIRDFMVVFGLTSSLFDFLTFGALLLVMRSTPDLFRTGWFVESLLTELFVVMVVRTRRPFYRSKPGFWLLVSTLIVAALTLAIPYLPFAGLLGFVPLPLPLLLLLLLITLLYVLATELVKQRFYAWHAAG